MAIYSTNPKMDTSGVRAEKPVYGYMGNQIGTKPKAGGEFYLEAISEQSDEYGVGKTNALTSDANMRAAASLVNQGYSLATTPSTSSPRNPCGCLTRRTS